MLWKVCIVSNSDSGGPEFAAKLVEVWEAALPSVGDGAEEEEGRGRIVNCEHPLNALVLNYFDTPLDTCLMRKNLYDVLPVVHELNYGKKVHDIIDKQYHEMTKGGKEVDMMLVLCQVKTAPLREYCEANGFVVIEYYESEEARIKNMLKTYPGISEANARRVWIDADIKFSIPAQRRSEQGRLALKWANDLLSYKEDKSAA